MLTQDPTPLNEHLSILQKISEDYLVDWLSKPVVPDFIIGPVGPSVAPQHDTARYWGYTAIFNILDYPSCAFPTGWFTSDKASSTDADYVPRDNEFDAYNWSNYDPQASAGAPISLQITGRKWHCEQVMAATARIAEILGVERGLHREQYHSTKKDASR